MRTLFKILSLMMLWVCTEGRFLFSSPQACATPSMYVLCSATNPNGEKRVIGCLVWPETAVPWPSKVGMLNNYSNCADVFSGQNSTGWTDFNYQAVPVNNGTAFVTVGCGPEAANLTSSPLKANPGYAPWPSNSPCINIHGTSPGGRP